MEDNIYEIESNNNITTKRAPSKALKIISLVSGIIGVAFALEFLIMYPFIPFIFDSELIAAESVEINIIPFMRFYLCLCGTFSGFVPGLVSLITGIKAKNKVALVFAIAALVLAAILFIMCLSNIPSLIASFNEI